MGWAKYTEDNYDAFYERQAMKGGDFEIQFYGFTSQQNEILKPKEESSFAEMFKGESCFSV